MQTAVESIKRAGMAADMYITILDEGCPPEVLGGDGGFFPWQSDFARQNPGFLAVDRSLPGSPRSYHAGVLEYAYPQVREYMLRVVTTFSDRFDLDGVFLSLRSHSPPADPPDRPGLGVDSDEKVARMLPYRPGDSRSHRLADGAVADR